MASAGRLRTSSARAFAVTLVAFLAAPFGAAAGPAGTCGSKVTTTPDGWRRALAPAFPSGAQSITSYGVAPHDGDVRYVTNGEAVARTTDAGCTWTTVYTLPETPSLAAPFVGPATTIQEVAVAEDRVYLLLEDPAKPHVVVSDDGGRTWETSVLPAVQSGSVMVEASFVVDASGTHAYLAVRPTSGLGTADLVYATHDGGATWSAASPGSVYASVNDVAVDPADGEHVWATTDVGLFRSTDGGERWTPVPLEAINGASSRTLGTIAVTTRRGGGTQVAVASAFESVLHIRDSVGSWTTVNTPANVTSVTGGRTSRQAVIATKSGVYELDTETLRWQPVHRGAPTLARLTTDYTNAPLIHACVCAAAGSSLWTRAPRPADDRREPRGPDDPPPPGGFPGYWGCAPDPRLREQRAPYPESSVTPARREVTVQPGKSVTVPVRFHARPRQLDVFFLLDTGPRSDRFGCAAKQGAVWAAEQLARARNLRVGAGQYRDHNRANNLLGAAAPECVGITDEFVYRREIRVGPLDDAFRKGMSRIAGSGCSGDYGGLTALLQAATGAGQDLLPPGATPGDIRAGQQAGFEDGALKVVVHVAGGWFNSPQRTPSYPGPTFDAVVDALAERGVKQVGIHVPGPPKKHHGEAPVIEYSDAEALQDLWQMALDTGAVAAAPASCGSLAKSTIGRGQPLVCTFTEVDDQARRKAQETPAMGDQIVELVTALRDPRRLRLSVLSGDAAVTRRSAKERRQLDHLVPHTLEYAVTFRCRPADAGLVKHAELGGHVGSSVVARTVTTVRCAAPPLPPTGPPRAQPQGMGLPVTAPGHVGAAIGQTIPNVQTQPQAQSQAQSQSQPQAQGGLQGVAVGQEQSEPRLAYADAEDPRQSEELAMSGLDRDAAGDVPGWLFVGAAGLMACGAGGVAVRQRARAAPSVAVARR